MPATKNNFSPFPFRSVQDPNLHSGEVTVTGTLTVDLGIGHNNFVVAPVLKSIVAATVNAASEVTWDYGSKLGTFTIACWKTTNSSTNTLIAATAAVVVSFTATVDSSVG